ncbi:MAG: hypothetical protein JWN15_891 [Firmicutes bacterium]|jgi:hypothetical protein|nr:hypothetical protein [Bacillota bacterium]
MAAVVPVPPGPADHRPARIKRAVEVHLYDYVPLSRGDLLARLVHLALHAAGHVDQHLDPAFGSGTDDK